LSTPHTPPEEPKTVAVLTRLDPELREQLARRAADNDRTLSAELRRAIRFYLASGEAAA
jgi:predicted transcriptional regulator